MHETHRKPSFVQLFRVILVCISSDDDDDDANEENYGYYLMVLYNHANGDGISGFKITDAILSTYNRLLIIIVIVKHLFL